MHRTEGDGFITDPIGGQNIYADENPPIRDATQLRHEEANSFQEEICNVILHAGASLNSGSESVQQMVQLRDAINLLIANSVSAEATVRFNADGALTALITSLVANQIGNDSSVSGTKVKDALNTLLGGIGGNTSAIAALVASVIGNDSSVSGTKVKDALNTLLGGVNGNASDISTNAGLIALNNAHRVGTGLDHSQVLANKNAILVAIPLEWKTDVATIVNSLSPIGGGQQVTYSYNVTSTPGWIDLDNDDLIQVIRRGPATVSSWDGNDAFSVLLAGSVVDANTILFGAACTRDASQGSWTPTPNHLVTVRVLRKVS